MIPKRWKHANIISIYMKKSDHSICGNSRGISPGDVAGKILACNMICIMTGNRPRGGPKQRFRDYLKCALVSCNIDPTQLENLARVSLRRWSGAL